MSGQKIVDMDLPENGLSEVLRLFIKSRRGHEEEVGICTGNRRLLLYVMLRKFLCTDKTFSRKSRTDANNYLLIMSIA